MKKFIILLIIFVGVPVGALYALSTPLIELASDKVFAYLVDYGEASGLDVQQLDFEEAGLRGLNAAGWTNLAIQATLPRDAYLSSEKSFRIEVGELKVSIVNLLSPEFKISADRVKVERRTDKLDPSEASNVKRSIVKANEFRMPVKLNLYSPLQMREDSRWLLHQLRRFAEEGVTLIPVQFKGNSLFPVNKMPFVTRVWTEKQGQETTLRMGSDDLERISHELSEKLTQPEIELLSRFPLRVPRLLRIREVARNVSKQARVGNPSVPEDAYRHVLWSFLLTRAYGDEFAQKVTDAHEQGETDNTEAEHRMDYQNNKIGREYARSGARESELLKKLLSDSRVIKKAI